MITHWSKEALSNFIFVALDRAYPGTPLPPLAIGL
jgi:hypothetical protein